MVSWLFSRPRSEGLNPADDRYYEHSSSKVLSRAGVAIDAESAMRASTVYRCVSILANILAMFPKGMFEHLDRGRRPAPEHPLDSVISFRPNRRQNAFVFWRQVCYNLVLRQNAYVQIVQGSRGRGWVGELIPLHPDRVYGPEELSDGSLRYEYRPKGGGAPIRMMGGTEMWHVPGLSSDGLRGLSMIDVANDSIGLALASERHAARFFERGVKPTGVLQHEKTLKPDTARAMSESFGRLYGGESGTGRVPVLWEGMKFQPVSMTLKDAEFLDSRKFSVAEIARWFGVPPHMVGDVERSTSWGTGIEQQGLHFLVYSLLPWITLLEESIRFTLVVQPERYYPKFNTSAILRMDAKTQADVFGVLIDKGVMNPNECRELLERNPRPGGDKYVDVAAPPPAAEPFRVDPEPEDEEDEDEDGPPPGADAELVKRARMIAKARAVELLTEERTHLAKIARENAKRAEAWASATHRFYGHFAARIAGALACEKDAARAWCDARRGLVLSRGLAEIFVSDGTWALSGSEDPAETLVALSLGGGF